MFLFKSTVHPASTKRFKTAHLWDIVKFIAVIVAISWLISVGTARLGYNWQWYRVSRYIYTIDAGSINAGPLIKGVLVTFQITAVSLVMAFAVGLSTAFMRLSSSPIARILSRGYLEIVRNTPLLVQIFFIYFVLAPILDIGRFSSAVIALSLFEGAYASEIFRAGIVSIPRGQWEAADSIGLGTYYTYRHIILPQAVRWVLPPLTGQAISLIKDSALVSTIAIYDLTMQGQAIISETYMVFEIWFIVALIYLLITGTLSVCVNIMERHLRIIT